MDVSQLKLLTINNETILPIVLHGDGTRPARVLEHNKKVLVDYFDLPINYIICPFPYVSHGSCIDEVIKLTIDTIKPTYYFFIDSDCVILKKECIGIMYDLVKNKMTIAGQKWQSNHVKGPNSEMNHPYISQAFIIFPTELYSKLGRPSCDHYEYTPGFGGDTMERLTYEVEKNGYCVAGFYPSSSVIKNCDLGNGAKFGMGNIYGDNLMAHASQQDNPESEKWFVEKCQEVLDGKYL